MMTTLPPAGTPKYLEVSEALEAEVLTGRWDGGKIPSVRWVAEHYRVSAVTASRALQVLRDKGLVHTVERSGCFRVAPPTADRWSLVLRATPGPWQAATVALVRGGFDALARRQPMHVAAEAFPADPAAAVRGAKARGVTGIVLLPSRYCAAEAAADEAMVAACRAEGLPVVLLERNLRGAGRELAADLVAGDDVDGAARVTRHLLDRRRTRVGVAVASPTSSHHDRVAGYLVALHAGAAGSPPVVIRLPDDLPPAEAAARLADEVLARGLDGVVCYADYAAAGLVAELRARGVDVPGVVAVAGFDDYPAAASDLGITTVTYPAEGIAEQAVRLLKERQADPTRPPVKVAVPGRLVVRASTGG